MADAFQRGMCRFQKRLRGRGENIQNGVGLNAIPDGEDNKRQHDSQFTRIDILDGHQRGLFQLAENHAGIKPQGVTG